MDDEDAHFPIDNQVAHSPMDDEDAHSPMTSRVIYSPMGDLIRHTMNIVWWAFSDRQPGWPSFDDFRDWTLLPRLPILRWMIYPSYYEYSTMAILWWITRLTRFAILTSRINITSDVPGCPFSDGWRGWTFSGDFPDEHSPMDDEVEHSLVIFRLNILRWVTRLNITSDFPGCPFSDGLRGWTLFRDDEIEHYFRLPRLSILR